MKKNRNKLILITLIILFSVFINSNAQNSNFKKTILTRDFVSEGVAVADLNKDGKQDIIAGYYWFEAPTWARHEFAPARIFDPRKEYSESFLNSTLDVNLDGWEDVIIVDYPGKPGFWFENPKNKSNTWLKHIIADSMGIANESPAFIDFDGDGRKDILCADPKKKQIVWLQAPLKKGGTTWKRYALSDENVPATDRYSHGIGLGDINGDKINDVIITEGWFEGKKNKKEGNYVFHKADLGDPCSHMQVLDFNNDGKNDVLCASAHKLGVWWYEQFIENGKINFKKYTISNTTSQTHSSIMADLNGDGKPEFITGKRYLAHNGNDPGDSDEPILMYFELNSKKTPYYKEIIIDNDSGAGLNIAIKDMNNDKKPDIVIANKNGVFLLENHLPKQ